MSIKLQTIGVIAGNMSKTLAFYRTLGLDIPEGLDEESNYEFETPSGIVLGFLAESTARQADPKFVTPVGQSMNLQFQADSPAAVDQVYKKLTDAGYKSYAEPWDAFWGQRFARVTDPDGRVVNIHADL